MEGLILIKRHLDDSMPVWDSGRWISVSVRTASGKKNQKFRLVRNEQEALAYFKAKNFLDCRIRAYHSIDNTYTNIAPSILLVDIDKEYFNDVEFEQAVEKTRVNFRNFLDVQPTELWTGKGVHFILSQYAILIETIPRFKKLNHVKDGIDVTSRDFMRFEEQFLSDGKADQHHSNNISFGNCMLRIPGSLNFNEVYFNEKGEIIDIPPKAEVRVTRYWDETRPSIKPLMPEYYIWLQVAVSRDIDRQMENIKYGNYNNRQSGRDGKKIDWIDDLLEISLNDFRKYSVKFILARYLMNIKGLSYSDAYDALSIWLNNCDLVHRLDFDIDKKIDEALGMVHDYLPKGRNGLKYDFPPLYERLEKEGIFY